MGWAIAIPSDAVADTLDAIGEKLMFLQLKGDTMFLEDVAVTFKQEEKRGDQSRPQKDLVDENAVTKMQQVGRVTRSEKNSPFDFEDMHHGGVKGRRIVRPERRTAKTQNNSFCD